jgi:hypothetical protein
MKQSEFIVVTAVTSDVVNEDPRVDGIGPFVPTVEESR